LKEGDSFRFSRTFNEEDVEAFAKLTRDYNPVHFEERWCRLKGFRTPICHGLLVGSMLCEPGGQWGWLANGMTFSFLKPVYLGDTVTCEMTIVELDERCFARAACVLTNQEGDVVMEAVLTGYLPDAEARELLGTMVAEGDPSNPLGS
jgi:3-hydroxybutyryl-CoA dehydratase